VDQDPGEPGNSRYRPEADGRQRLLRGVICSCSFTLHLWTEGSHAAANLACDFFVAVTAWLRTLSVWVVTGHGTRSLLSDARTGARTGNGIQVRSGAAHTNRRLGSIDLPGPAQSPFGQLALRIASAALAALRNHLTASVSSLGTP